jgi:DeoR/GlpR family transcriptional regulator of sugar metabolism
MFIEERHEKILELVRNHGRVEVQELCGLFGISEDSARRDLRLMEKKGLVERTYGGAILPKSAGFVAPFQEREELNAGNKTSIAALAASFVRDGDTLFLDGSTTVARMIPQLVQRNHLTVFTHSVEIAHEVLGANAEIELYLIGGRVDRSIGSALGAETCEQIGRLHADRVFTAPCGLSAKWGLSCSSAEEAPVKRAVLEAGKEVYLLAPGDALGKRSLLCYAPIRSEDTILTDASYRPRGGDEFSALAANGLKILTAGKEP